MYDIVELNSKLVADLRQIAKDLNIPKAEKLLKKDLIYKILDQQALNPAPKKDDRDFQQKQAPKKSEKKTKSTNMPIANPENKGSDKSEPDNKKKRKRVKTKPDPVLFDESLCLPVLNM